MAISKKKALLIHSLEAVEINRVIEKIYDDLNDVINSVNQSNTSEERKSFKGKSGDIRLAKVNDGSYEIQGKTDEGWVYAIMKVRNR
jgi:hypothetical protein|tara:strand:+ start:5331 stop:5591 length:261 start_codon:yes stop_codon:yes gene_type:complete